MNNSKSILILFFIYFNVLNNTYSQGQNLHTHIDSLDYLNIATFLDTTDVTDLEGMARLDYNLLNDNNRTRLSYIILFTTVFDCFLRKGLDLDSNMIPSPPQISFDMSGSMIVGHHRSYEEEVYLKKSHMLFAFVRIKERCERIIPYMYKESEQNILEEDIKNAVTYGLCSHPKIVTDILLSKYKHITREKISLETKH
jgi:hypothetical protein